MTQEIISAAKAVNPNIIALCHGGRIVTPEDTQYMYNHTDAVGYIGASSIERIPVEKALINIVRQFKSKTIKKST